MNENKQRFLNRNQNFLKLSDELKLLWRTPFFSCFQSLAWMLKNLTLFYLQAHCVLWRFTKDCYELGASYVTSEYFTVLLLSANPHWDWFQGRNVSARAVFTRPRRDGSENIVITVSSCAKPNKAGARAGVPTTLLQAGKFRREGDGWVSKDIHTYIQTHTRAWLYLQNIS